MDWPLMSTLPLFGAGSTVLLGTLGLLRPDLAADLVGIAPEGSLGRAELRATYGGLFAGLGVAVLWLQTPDAYLVASAAWFGAAAARTVAVGIDRAATVENAAGIVLEAGIGLLLLSGV